MTENLPHETLLPSAPVDTAGITVATREQTEIQSAMIIAKKYPRNELHAYNELLKACQRPGLANDANYSFPRGGETIEGPSVDLARAAALKWGNLRFGVRFISADEEYIHIKGYAIDLESNTSAELDDKFRMLIQRKVKGGKEGETHWIKPNERDLRELVNRRGAILERNAILKLIPRDVIDAARKIAKETAKKAARNELEANLEDYLRSMVSTFDKIGVSVDMLTRYLGHDIKVTTVDEVVDLKAIHKAIKDGQAKREDYFNFDGKEIDSRPLNERVAANKKDGAQNG